MMREYDRTQDWDTGPGHGTRDESQSVLSQAAVETVMHQLGQHFITIISSSSVEIKRELRYCDGFKCRTIHFIPQVVAPSQSDVYSLISHCIINLFTVL